MRPTSPLAVAAATAAVAIPALLGVGAATAAPGDALLARADALAQQWGRCPTSRPAHRLLVRAHQTTRPALRVRRARASLRAWTAVAAECARPVPQPTVNVGG